MNPSIKFRFAIITIIFAVVGIGLLAFTSRQVVAKNLTQSPCVAGPHSGTISADESWCLADSPHILEGVVTIASGVKVTVEPGAIVQTDSYPYYMGLVVQGELESVGTDSQAITFTHIDANGQWKGIVIDGGSATLTYTTVEWGCSDDLRSNIRVVNGGNLAMTDSLVQECHNGSGTSAWNLLIDNASANVSNTRLIASEYYPIYITGTNSQVTLTNNILEENYYNRILLGTSAMMGHDSTLTPQAEWESYELEGSLTVPLSVTLTLEPGVVIKTDSYPYNMGIFVQGNLQAIGTPTQPITLTSVDGVPSWAGLVVDGGNASLDYTTVEYGCSDTTKSNIAVINNGQLEMANSLVQECSYGGGAGEESLWVEDSQAFIQNTTFRESGGEHIYVNGDSTVLISGSSIEGASETGLLVEGDQAYVRVTNSTILSNGVWGGDGVRNTGNATVILSGDPDQGNFIAFNQDYGANQVGLSGQVIATYNFWGDPSGPTHSGNPGGTGEPVTDRVLYDPWLTEPPGGTLPANLVQVFGPNYVSSGETLNIGFLLNNVLTETLHNTVLVSQLPEEAEYLQSTPQGEYWPERHQLVWKLGDVTPDETIYLAVQVRYVWGLEAHLVTYSNGLVAAENLPNELIDLDEYLAYEQVTVTSFEELSNEELDDLLAVNPDLDALYQDAVSQGFSYYGAARLEHLSDGIDQVSLPMINISAPGETIYLTHRVTGAQRLHEYPEAILGDCLSATYQYDYPTGYLELWEPFTVGSQQTAILSAQDSLLGCDDFGLEDCLHNCLVWNLYSHQFEQSLSNHCRNCYSYGEDCSLCAMDLSFFHSPSVESIVDQCQNTCGDPSTRDLMKCDNETRQCVSSHTRLVTPCKDCEFDPAQNYFEACPSGTRCVNGGCKPIQYPDTLPLEVLVAGDPNHMVGPAVMAPGQTVSYTIAFENVGEGTAYGVYVESQLPDIFDASTLLLHDDGTYFSTSRTLLWEVGELAPGAGGTASFEVQVPAEAPGDSIVIASATVYFPSVPEITPTGEVVSVVEDVVAHAQQVETTEGVSVPVTLTGYTPTGIPLTFDVVGDPLQGELSGTVPYLTYTPSPGYEGVDYFTFQVSDDLNTSHPATVMLNIQTGSESEPPEVWYTSPLAGENEVPLLDTPVYTDTYAPTILAWFSEPLDPTSVTTETVFLTGPGGVKVAGTVVFVAGTNRVEFRPSEALKPGTLYTVTITTGVYDTSGNALADPYTWVFRTKSTQVTTFLPMVEK
jgi:uncharacterized repeat protein (TIGR01451 family)